MLKYSTPSSFACIDASLRRSEEKRSSISTKQFPSLRFRYCRTSKRKKRRQNIINRDSLVVTRPSYSIHLWSPSHSYLREYPSWNVLRHIASYFHCCGCGAACPDNVPNRRAYTSIRALKEDICLRNSWGSTITLGSLRSGAIEPST
jgi:hypothetical protein